MRFLVFIAVAGVCFLGKAQTDLSFKEAYQKVKKEYKNSYFESDAVDIALEKCQDINQYPDLLVYKAIQLDLKDERVLANKYINLALPKLKNDTLLFEAYASLAISQSGEKSIEFIKKALVHAEKLGDNQKITECQINILLLKDELYHSEETRDDLVNFFFKLPENNEGLDQHAKDFEELDKMLYLSSVYGVTQDKRLLSIYENKKKYYLDDGNINNLDIPFQKEVYSSLASIALRSQNFTDAISYANKANVISKKHLYDRDIIFSYTILKDIYEAKGEEITALKYADSANVYDKKIQQKEFENAIDIAKENALFHHMQKEDKAWIRNLYIVLCLVFGGVILLAFYLSKSKKSKKRISQKLAKNKKELFKKENKLHHAKEQYNQLWAEYKLTTEQLEATKEALLKQIKEKQDNNQELNKVLKNISLHLNTTPKEEYKHINILKEQFAQKVQEEAPFLNTQEQLVCFFLNMNLSHKKIGELLKKSEKSIDSYKYRINVKLKKEKQTDINYFLQSIAS